MNMLLKSFLDSNPVKILLESFVMGKSEFKYENVEHMSVLFSMH